MPVGSSSLLAQGGSTSLTLSLTSSLKPAPGKRNDLFKETQASGVDKAKRSDSKEFGKVLKSDVLLKTPLRKLERETGSNDEDLSSQSYQASQDSKTKAKEHLSSSKINGEGNSLALLPTIQVMEKVLSWEEGFSLEKQGIAEEQGVALEPQGASHENSKAQGGLLQDPDSCQNTEVGSSSHSYISYGALDSASLEKIQSFNEKTLSDQNFQEEDAFQDLQESPVSGHPAGGYLGNGFQKMQKQGEETLNGVALEDSPVLLAALQASSSQPFEQEKKLQQTNLGENSMDLPPNSVESQHAQTLFRDLENKEKHKAVQESFSNEEDVKTFKESSQHTAQTFHQGGAEISLEQEDVLKSLGSQGSLEVSMQEKSLNPLEKTQEFFGKGEAALFSSSFTKGGAENSLTLYTPGASASNASSVVIPQVIQGFYMARQEAVNKFQIQMNPPFLGTVEVNLELKDGRIKAVFSAKKDTLNLLKDYTHDLRTSLQALGIEVDSESFSFTLDPGGSQSSPQKDLYSGGTFFEGKERNDSLLLDSKETSPSSFKGPLYPVLRMRALDEVV